MQQLPEDYWRNFRVGKADLEALQAYFFDTAKPITTLEMVGIVVAARLARERKSRESQRPEGSRMFLPREQYGVGATVLFPQRQWSAGTVQNKRSGFNPQHGAFEVIGVEFSDGSQAEYACGLDEHKMNRAASADNSGLPGLDVVLEKYGAELATLLETQLAAESTLAKGAGRWFSKGLLVGVSTGQLNLAEAALDMAQGEPQSVGALMREVDMPSDVAVGLAEFSLNVALGNDIRFEDVGPAGEVRWVLRRLEPESVREVPLQLRCADGVEDRGRLSDAMLALERQLDDELALQGPVADKDVKEVTQVLLYPHLRTGTLPLAGRARSLFPSALESPRVRFDLVDARSKVRMPAWVVRDQGYVYGLSDWYRSHQLMPGSLITLRKGSAVGEVLIEARLQRSSKDWLRTLIVGADGGMVFAMLKQPITAEFNDRMAIYIGDVTAPDLFWRKVRPLDGQVVEVMRELTKVNPQGHVHAQELYAAVNLVRRCAPARLFSLLASDSRFVHVGDLHYRLEVSA